MSDVIMVNTISADVPAVLASRYGRDPAAGYVTGGGDIEWTEGQFAEFARKIRIDQQAGVDPAVARIARCKDVETGAGRAEDVPPFLEARRPLQTYPMTTVYCNLATVPAVLNATSQFLAVPEDSANPATLAQRALLAVPRWWLAWWQTGAGIPTRDQVLAELHRLTGVELPLERLWACQYRSDPQWELSVVYGAPDFDR